MEYVSTFNTAILVPVTVGETFAFPLVLRQA
jgi:hypothetical protein